MDSSRAKVDYSKQVKNDSGSMPTDPEATQRFANPKRDVDTPQNHNASICPRWAMIPCEIIDPDTNLCELVQCEDPPEKLGLSDISRLARHLSGVQLRIMCEFGHLPTSLSEYQQKNMIEIIEEDFAEEAIDIWLKDRLTKKEKRNAPKGKTIRLFLEAHKNAELYSNQARVEEKNNNSGSREYRRSFLSRELANEKVAEFLSAISLRSLRKFAAIVIAKGPPVRHALEKLAANTRKSNGLKDFAAEDSAARNVDSRTSLEILEEEIRNRFVDEIIDWDYIHDGTTNAINEVSFEGKQESRAQPKRGGELYRGVVRGPTKPKGSPNQIPGELEDMLSSGDIEGDEGLNDPFSEWFEKFMSKWDPNYPYSKDPLDSSE